VAEQEARWRTLREGRAYLLRELGLIGGVVALPSEANFVLIDVGRCGISADAVVAALLERGLLVRSLTAHHAGRSMVRISIGMPEQNARCVAALREVLGRRPLRQARIS
jgi:histidinol-phosphate aminotransferase